MAVVDTFTREVIALVDALASPNKIIDKVEHMDKLYR